MEPPEEKISVWICQEEKIISGLSRRTTCSDVVRVLLEDSRQRRQQQQPRRRRRRRRARGEEGGGEGEGDLRGGEPREPEEDDEEAPAQGMLWGPPQCYCIVEKWRGFERILPNKTRILRLWAAWGDEQENVRFVLVRSEASLPNAGPRSAEARVVLSKESPCSGRGGPARPSPALTQEKQRRVVRKAFRKLAKINRRRQQQPPSPCSSTSTSSSTASSSSSPPSQDSASGERMETLVHLVLSQDHTIRQQVQRIRELDREIDRYEAKVHLDRMRRHGVNYVQDTYLVGPAAELDGTGTPQKGPDEEPPSSNEEDPEAAALAEYARRCEQMLQLQEQRAQQEELLERVAAEIQEELNQRWMRRRQEELSGQPGPDAEGGPEGELLLEQERLKTQLSTSLYIGLRLSTDLEAIKSDLDYSQQQWELKERELQSLLETLESLDFVPSSDGAGEPGSGAPGPVEGEARAGEEAVAAGPGTGGGPGPEVWVDQARGLAKGCQGNDEDSDTGLSSMHSQDSDSVPVCESLV
ncbi:ras association domain-containing protein 10 [Antechinus flavipes]|uniref:ras association domain-containing protein 10 n=1 Tax=Antechinus flavipes TaxID=38775 RepID=UPI002236A7B6|nr:ras association domain-containing protein 10 [Antechinus flavipes]